MSTRIADQDYIVKERSITAAKNGILVVRDGSEFAISVDNSIHSQNISIVELSAYPQDEEAKFSRIRCIVSRKGEDSAVISIYGFREGNSWEYFDGDVKEEALSQTIRTLCTSDHLEAEEEEDNQENLGDANGAFGVDLGYALSILSRDNLEMLVVKMSAKYPEIGEMIIKESRKPAEIYDMEADILDVLEQISENEADDSSFSVIDDYIERAENFCKASDTKNCISVLKSICKELVDWVCKAFGQGLKDLDISPELKRKIDSWFSLLEERWQELFVLIEKGIESPSRSELKELYQHIAQWRQRLIPVLGPIFSDPLRMFKLIIENSSKNSSSKSKRTEQPVSSEAQASKRSRKHN